MKEIIKITFALTISCMIAASAMGLTYMVTAKAKKHNHHMNVYNAMVGLLGFGEDNPAPSDLKFLSVYRYIVEDGDKKFLGYMVPVEKGSEEAYEMVLMDLEGNFVEKLEVPISAEKVEEDLDRAKALQEVLAPPKTFSYADSSVVATSGGKRLGYVMPGKFPGFRTFIHALVAMDPKFELLGLEVMEHEEDAGLGKNIEEEYFKNQFKGKTYEKLQTLKGRYCRDPEAIQGCGHLRHYRINDFQQGRHRRCEDPCQEVRLSHRQTGQCAKERKDSRRVLGLLPGEVTSAVRVVCTTQTLPKEKEIGYQGENKQTALYRRYTE